MYFESYIKCLIGETQRVKLLRNTVSYRKILNGKGFANKVISLGQAHGEKTLFKNGKLAFPGFSRFQY